MKKVLLTSLILFSFNTAGEIAPEIKTLKDNKNYSEVFKLATNQALKDFKGKKIKIGRARMFEDKTKDLDDPGMFAFNKLSETF